MSRNGQVAMAIVMDKLSSSDSNEFETFLPLLMSRAFQLIIIDMLCHHPLACGNHIHYKDLGRKYMYINKIWENLLDAKLKFTSWGS